VVGTREKHLREAILAVCPPSREAMLPVAVCIWPLRLAGLILCWMPPAMP